MKNAFVNTSLNYLIKNNACNDKDIKIFRYTLESLYSLCTKTTVVLLLSIILNNFKITLISLILYSLLRGFTFGIHATKNIYCWIITLSVYIVFPYLIKSYEVENPILFGINIIGILAILLWAPADTPNRPLLNRKKRITNKVISLMIAIIYIVLMLFINNQNFNEIVSFILLLNALCICPLTYYLFHIPYNNYKYYHK